MKYHIEKNTVQETLVIPLFGRLVCSERFPELFSDPEAKRNERKWNLQRAFSGRWRWRSDNMTFAVRRRTI